jgi:phosphoribosylamine--glycine ligase
VYDDYVTTIMLVSGGYPGTYKKGKVISGLDKVNNSVVFHAGTMISGDEVLTSGGRVIAVSSRGKTMKEALAESYHNAGLISFGNIYYRTDIGFDL